MLDEEGVDFMSTISIFIASFPVNKIPKYKGEGREEKKVKKNKEGGRSSAKKGRCMTFVTVMDL